MIYPVEIEQITWEYHPTLIIIEGWYKTLDFVLEMNNRQILGGTNSNRDLSNLICIDKKYNEAIHKAVIEANEHRGNTCEFLSIAMTRILNDQEDNIKFDNNAEIMWGNN